MKHVKKSLGQNFLIDLNIIKKITETIDITDKNVLEIGPGKGALTDQILKKKPKSLLLVEKDNSLSTKLKLKHKNNKKVFVINDDILKFNLEKNLKDKTIIFGNLPYNIASQILVKIIRVKNYPSKYSCLVLMFQKEMADRIIGKYGTSKYGRLSILTNYKLKINKTFDVSAHCFFPKPKVKSTVISFQPKNTNLYKIKKVENLEKITNIIFSNKRKMINKNIKKIFSTKEISYILKDLNLKARPSDLKPESYFKLTQLYERFN